MNELTEEQIKEFCDAHGITVEKYYELLNANDDLEWLLPEIVDSFLDKEEE